VSVNADQDSWEPATHNNRSDHYQPHAGSCLLQSRHCRGSAGFRRIAIVRVILIQRSIDNHSIRSVDDLNRRHVRLQRVVETGPEQRIQERRIIRVVAAAARCRLIAEAGHVGHLGRVLSRDDLRTGAACRVGAIPAVDAVGHAPGVGVDGARPQVECAGEAQAGARAQEGRSDAAARDGAGPV